MGYLYVMPLNLKFFILFSFFPFVCLAQKDNNTSVVDSIGYYLNLSSTNNDKFRVEYALRAKELSERYNLDSLRLKSLFNLTSIYSDRNSQYLDYDLFLDYSHKALKLAEKIKDTNSLALVNKNLGYYYFDESVDSAYYYNNKAEKYYRALNDNFHTAVVLLDIASLQKGDKDYTGSEINFINGLNLLDKLEQTDQVKRYKSYYYNNLALLLIELDHYDESIEYSLKSLELKKQLKGDNTELIETQKNNIGNVYKNTKDYDLALKYYGDILKNEKFINQWPNYHALVLDNYAHTLFLDEKYDQLPGLFFKALKICDSIGESYNKIVMYQHLSQYYEHKKQMDSARYYAHRAVDESYPNYTERLLESYKILAEVESDSNAVKYYNAYIKLNDSLLKNERSTRNKFFRIQYETDQIEQENEQIAKERMWLLIISIVLVIASFLVYVIINQRNKNKELKFIQQQQEANEEIYNLMLSQNESIEEARTLEKKRISQELHDGVLGRLFGARLSLDSLNMSTNPESITARGEYISQLKTIEEDIRKVSHELNTDFVSGAGFVDIINTLVETQTNIYELKYKLDNDGAINWDNIPNRTKIHIYRIVQETLHNIYKHAKATTVKISFRLKNNVICLKIIDNGSGFEVGKSKHGIGLKNINSRIKEIKGTFEVSSTLNKGTTVKINIPIN